MFALDLFNNDHERRLAEGAVDQLEQRRIDDLAMKMDDLVARAKKATTPEVKQALMKEFQKCKAERDSYYKVRNETMGYGGLVGEAGIPGNVPTEKIPGKEDLLKGKGRTYYEGEVTPVKGGIRHHAKPGNYGGYQPEPELKGLNKTLTKNLEKGMGVEFKRAKKFGGGIEVDEAGIPGSVPTEKIPGKEDLLKGKGRSYYESQKKNLDLSKGVIPTEPLPEHGGGIGPKQHWQDLMQENRLAVGDPVVVTGPNEFEGKTGEIYDFAPSGTFVIVDLYNHGKHSMHLSDIAYNEYADQEQDEDDDWYDDEVDEGWKGGVAGGVAGATGGEVLGSKAGEALGKVIGGHIGASTVPAPLSSLGSKAGEAIGSVVGSKLGAVVGALAGSAGGAAIGNKLGDEVDEGYASTIGINPPALDPVSQWKFNVRQLIADYIKNPQGLYNLAKQKGANSAEATAYKYIMHPKGKIALPPDAVTFEGFQDFNKVEPYAVCLAGKPVKKFDYYEQARKFHDNWKQKLYREGDKAKADTITLMPLNLDEGATVAYTVLVVDPETYEKKTLNISALTQDHAREEAEAKGYKVLRVDSEQGVAEGSKIKTFYAPDGKTVTYDPSKDHTSAPVDKKVGTTKKTTVSSRTKTFYAPDGKTVTYNPNKGVAEGQADQQRKVFKKNGKPVGEVGIDRESSPGAGQWYMKCYAPSKDLVGYNSYEEAVAELKHCVKQGVAEAETDYSKRRQRERDVDAGKPVSKQRPSKMTDYQKRRAQDKKDMALGEDQDTSGVESAIIRRIMVAHTDLLRQFGPEKVMQAAEEVAYNVGDVDEIGTSDVSAYVAQVKQILGVPEELDEKWSQKYKSSINCANPKGFSQKAHCASKKK